MEQVEDKEDKRKLDLEARRQEDGALAEKRRHEERVLEEKDKKSTPRRKEPRKRSQIGSRRLEISSLEDWRQEENKWRRLS